MKVNIVKIGGNVIDDATKLQQFLKDFAQIEGPKILIHGGGKIATNIAEKLGIATQMVEGRRITNEPMRDVVTMVYGGLINKQIVASLQAYDCNSLGLTGADAQVIVAKKRPVKTIDYGFVGDIVNVNSSFIQSILDQQLTPVFAPLTFDPNTGILNTNADTQASAIAVALASSCEVNLIYCFEKKGVLADPSDNDSVIPLLHSELYAKYKSEGMIYEGMIPKLDNAFEALTKGVKKVLICHADDLIDALKNQKAGTTLVKHA
jgi:acetylglutamate kinase